ncbi:MAG: hypothetical protein KQ78_00968 [Candidatus Izimaplasma bacterium HR2]|nr:MAG: hypothetical protein KQ78_00968 [Candidatus Izimaplasma bacterium HR2]
MAQLDLLNHFWLTLLLLLPVILISRTVVAGTKYSPILIIVIFGLSLGLILEVTGIATPGLPEFPVVGLSSGVTITALIVTFFVGGQKLRNTFYKPKDLKEDDVILNEKEVMLGTKGTQLIFIIRAYFILLGIEGLKRIILGDTSGDLGEYYPLIAFFGLAGSIILIDNKAIINNKRKYLGRGITEIITILAVLILSYYIAMWIKDIIALPQIFFAMLLSSGLGMYFSDWRAGPTMRSLLFGGIPMVLAAVFIVGGTRLLDAFTLDGMFQVMAFGFFGQLFWMFIGIALLVFIGKSNKVEILAPGMAGSLSHSGLTGACTAGDLGDVAKERAPVMINIPFFGHLFVFTILAASASRNELYVVPGLIVVLIGFILTYYALKTLRTAQSVEGKEIKGLILFSLGWQLVAVFGGFIMLHFAGLSLEYAAMANASAISHFGLFASIQGGMFGEESMALISFIFAMPFLIHPIVFGMFGKAMSNNGEMPKKVVATLAIMGIVGVLFSLIIL